MELKNFPLTEIKEIFTAKTDGGYVGCIGTPLCIHITVDLFDNALKAANAARALNKQLNKKRLWSKSPENNCPKKTKKSSRSHKKQVGWQNRFYTLAEVENMPLLRFKEIWVILKDNKYVYDSLNHKEKKLFSLTPSSSQAQYFTSHETARCTMLTLRGVVGPGFKLMRMFIENKNP
jgi:hypothetical protein